MAITQMHAFGSTAGSHHGLAVGHAQVDLALDPGAEAQGSQANAAAIHVRVDVGHVAMQAYPGQAAGQCLQLLWGVLADDVQHHLWQCRVDQREHLTQQPAGAIDIGRVAEATDEHQVAALIKTRAVIVGFVQVGNQRGFDLRRILLQLRLFGSTDQDRDIGLRHHLQLPLAGTCRFGAQRRITGHLGPAGLTQVMQVDGIEDHPCLRGVFAHQRQAGLGQVVPDQHHRAETWAVFAQPAAQAAQCGRRPGFDAVPAQTRSTDIPGRSGGGHNHHMRAVLAQQLDQVGLAQRGRIPIRLWQGFIDDQHLPLLVVQQGR